MFSLAIKAKMLTTKPPLPTIRVENARKGFFKDDQIEKVFVRLPKDLAPAIEFAWRTGWRIGEIRKLTWTKHVDFNTGVIRLDADEVKNVAGKSFPFAAHPSFARLLIRQMEWVDALQKERKQVIKWL